MSQDSTGRTTGAFTGAQSGPRPEARFDEHGKSEQSAVQRCFSAAQLRCRREYVEQRIHDQGKLTELRFNKGIPNRD